MKNRDMDTRCTLLILLSLSWLSGVTCLTRTQRQLTGIWSSWTQWSACSASCGQGGQVRARHCNQGSDCVGNIIDQQTCIINACDQPINPSTPPTTTGVWSSWSQWSVCSASCGQGGQVRARHCDQGSDCVGKLVDQQTCNIKACVQSTNTTMSPTVIEGGWTDFVDRPCSVTCGYGVIVSARTCTNPAPQNGGKPCSGSTTSVRGCIQPLCAVDGQWGEWSDMSSCKVICGDGNRYRSRDCDSPVPRNGGKDCVGDSNEAQPCSNGVCPPDFHICNKMKLMSAITAVGTSATCYQDSADIISTYCHAPSDTTHWELTISIQGVCEQTPLFSPVGFLNSTTRQKHFGILTACFMDALEIAYKTCNNEIGKRMVRAGEPNSDFHLIHW